MIARADHARPSPPRCAGSYRVRYWWRARRPGDPTRGFTGARHPDKRKHLLYDSLDAHDWKCSHGRPLRPGSDPRQCGADDAGVGGATNGSGAAGTAAGQTAGSRPARCHATEHGPPSASRSSASGSTPANPHDRPPASHSTIRLGHGVAPALTGTRVAVLQPPGGTRSGMGRHPSKTPRSSPRRPRRSSNPRHWW